MTKYTKIQNRCSNVHFFTEYMRSYSSLNVFMPVFSCDYYLNSYYYLIIIFKFCLSRLLISFNIALHVRKEIYSHRRMVRSICFSHQTILLCILSPSKTNLDGTTSLTQHDMKNHKVFLKKIHYPDIKLEDLYIGNILACYGRQLKIVDFADEFTRKNLLGESVTNK